MSQQTINGFPKGMIDEIIKQSWLDTINHIQDDIFSYQMEKPLPSVWAEANIRLPESTSVYPGPFRYSWTPYCVEIVNHFHPASPVRNVAVMKGSQSGLTAGVVIPGILYIISQCPDPILFTAADLQMAARTIAERLDPILRESKLDYLIRPNVVKKGSNRTGDTRFSKEYAGGTLTALGTNSADSFRFFSAKYAIPDDYDTAPRDLGQEGSVDKLIEGRQKSFGRGAKSVYISTPIKKGASNIEDMFLKGTMKKWHWWCPSCGSPAMTDFMMKQDDGTYAGLIWEVDERKKLIKSSIHFRTPCCGHLFDYSDKYDLNLNGFWLPGTDNPEEELFESYSLNDVFIPPGFDDWEKIVSEFLKACPPGEKVKVRELRAFYNQRLGQPFEEQGETPKATDLMANVRDYLPGVIPDRTSERDGNGKIVMLTLACDLNGIMEEGNEDVRLDWELCAHTQSGPTYSVDHGSIGTFKRTRDKTKFDKDNEEHRMKWTLVHNSVAENEAGVRVSNSVWPELEEMIKKIYVSETGADFDVMLTAVDTGFQEKLAMQFVTKMQEQGYNVFGVKGRTDEQYRKIQRDTQPVRRSTENPKRLYVIEVNQMKDDLAGMMRLREGSDGGIQPAGFMNFPQPNGGKYSYLTYFSHFEGERRIEVKKDDEVVGSYWTKKNSQSQNHFWDVRIYNLAAPLIYLDLVRQSDTKLRMLTMEELIMMWTA